MLTFSQQLLSYDFFNNFLIVSNNLKKAEDLHFHWLQNKLCSELSTVSVNVHAYFSSTLVSTVDTQGKCCVTPLACQFSQSHRLQRALKLGDGALHRNS